MFCARCGQQIPDDSRFCQICGQRASLDLIPAPAPVAAPYTPYNSVTVPQSFGPSGVGGWLLLYCILTSIGFIYGLARLSALWRFQNSLYLLSEIRLLYGGVVGLFLWMKSPVAITMLRIFFIMIGTYSLLLILQSVSLAAERHTTPVGTGFNSIVLPVCIAIAWFAYFHTSQRVRNTYGRNV